MEQSKLFPSKNPPVTYTDLLILNRSFVTATAYSSIFSVMSAIIFLLFMINDLVQTFFPTGNDNSIETPFLFVLIFVVMLPDTFVGAYKLKVNNKEINLNTLKTLWILRKGSQLDRLTMETLLISMNGILKFLAFVMIAIGQIYAAAISLISAGLFRILGFLFLQRSVRTDLPRIYTVILFVLSAAIEATLGFLILLYLNFSEVFDPWSLMLGYIVVSFFLLGVQALIKWSEKSSIEQKKYLNMTEDLKGILTSKDPTFGEVIAEMPNTLYRILSIQKITLYSAFVLAGIIYVFIIVFLNQEIDPFGNIGQFLSWAIPLIISSIATLIIISRTEESRFRTNLLFTQLERALENFQKTNEKYLAILEGE